ncbi:MAG: GNAT family N-acetyltransferase [Alphaproteobacteria bacterium]|nr:GNAT family N-acetyltransferase [Alphaproteobacteria bacterium]
MQSESVQTKSASLKELRFSPASPVDIDRLVALKIAVMRGELERLGRYTPERARDRFLAGFSPHATRLINIDGDFAGCVTVHDRGDHIEIEHLYLPPESQGAGLGRRVMERLMKEAAAAAKPIRLTVLNGSPANRFYKRLGFVETNRDAIDINYVWTA